MDNQEFEEYVEQLEQDVGSRGEYEQRQQVYIESLKRELRVIKSLYSGTKLTNKDKWKPEYDEDYYFIVTSSINDLSYVGHEVNFDYAVDMVRFSLGNYFKTPNDASDAISKLLIDEELKPFTMPYTRGVTQFMLGYNGMLMTLEAPYQNTGVFLFGSRAKADEAIEKVGEDRIVDFYFNNKDY